MNILYSLPYIFVQECELGYGVFTREFIPYNNLIHEAPYINLFAGECTNEEICNVIFRSSVEGQRHLILGYGSIFNHSDTNNVNYFISEEKKAFMFRAARDIQPHEQLFISYGEAWWNTRNLEKITDLA